MDAHGHHAVIACMSGFQAAHRRLFAGANVTSGSRDRLVRDNLSVCGGQWGLGNVVNAVGGGVLFHLPSEIVKLRCFRHLVAPPYWGDQ
jgi:hypothetical protein